jgi:hypothetical protein
MFKNGQYSAGLMELFSTPLLLVVVMDAPRASNSGLLIDVAEEISKMSICRYKLSDDAAPWPAPLSRLRTRNWVLDR